MILMRHLGNLMKFLSIWGVVLISSCLSMAQNGSMLGIRLGSQQIQTSHRIITNDQTGQLSTLNSKTKVITIEANYLHHIDAKKFIRVSAGTQLLSQKGQSTFSNPVFSSVGGVHVSFATYFIQLGMGRFHAFDKFILQYGAEVSTAFAFPYQSLAIYETELFQDSSYRRFEVRNYFPGSFIPSAGAFIGLHWNFAPHFFLGLEERFQVSARILNVETKSVRDTYDGNGVLTNHQVEKDRIRALTFYSPSYVSPPAILLTYRF
jgi:hypothetical protein